MEGQGTFLPELPVVPYGKVWLKVGIVSITKNPVRAPSQEEMLSVQSDELSEVCVNMNHED